MTDQDRLDLMIAYAAGALDEPEERAVRARLAAGDARLAGAYAEAQVVLARLCGTVPAVAPSPDLKQRLLDGLPAHLPPRRERTIDRGAAAGELRLAPSTAASVRSRPAWPRLALAAAVGAVLAGGPAAYVAVDRQRQTDRLAAAVAAEREEADRFRGALVTAQSEAVANILRLTNAAAEADALRRLVASGDVRLAAMSRPQDETKKPFGRVFWDVPNRQWRVYLFDLAPLPAGKEYQLWFLPGGNAPPVPAPTFKVDAGGRATLAVDLPPGVTNPVAAAVSEEPVGGSRTPTTVRLVGSL